VVEEQEIEIYDTQPSNPLAYQLDLDEELRNIYYTLKGIIPISGTKAVVGEPLLNDYGIQLVMTILRSYLHKGIVLSNLTDDDIREIAFWVGYDVATALMKEAEKTGVSDSKLELITDIVSDNVYATLRRARYGWTANSLKEQVRIEKVKIEERERARRWFG